MPKKFCKCGKSYTGKDRFCPVCMKELFEKGRGIKSKKSMLDEEIEEETEEVEPDLEENPGVDDEETPAVE